MVRSLFLSLQRVQIVCACEHVWRARAEAARQFLYRSARRNRTKVLKFDQTERLILHEFFCTNVIASSYYQWMSMLGLIFFVLEILQLFKQFPFVWSYLTNKLCKVSIIICLGNKFEQMEIIWTIAKYLTQKVLFPTFIECVTDSRKY